MNRYRFALIAIAAVRHRGHRRRGDRRLGRRRRLAANRGDGARAEAAAGGSGQTRTDEGDDRRQGSHRRDGPDGSSGGAQAPAPTPPPPTRAAAAPRPPRTRQQKDAPPPQRKPRGALRAVLRAEPRRLLAGCRPSAARGCSAGGRLVGHHARPVEQPAPCDRDTVVLHGAGLGVRVAAPVVGGEALRVAARGSVAAPLGAARKPDVAVRIRARRRRPAPR